MLPRCKKYFLSLFPRIDDRARVEPVSRLFGFDRGTPIDRRYIEHFLASNSEYIKGVSLEIADNTYSREFGGNQVERFEVLHKDNSLPQCTIAGDLEKKDSLPENHVDIFICTQTLPCLFDVHTAVRNIHRVLKPGGAVLCTLSCISPISRYDADRWGEFWRFTPQGAERLFRLFFSNVAVVVYGNCLAAKSFIDGLAVEDFADPKQLDMCDEDYPVIIAVRARKDAHN
jgi:SAM-dependent methyltransferase